ncbi:hypothetical protein FVR03_06015 [Pontibacter qinzhouensis]|uniref:Lipoprotein n=1 Tax=Pontibacter qinzhouensis TaxID=2603253 RepID=A0A5C8K8B2_9BACT|nr:hypothetical protein [Pontibacter qinzhouensis]TXK49645.1 hypothetical protein FVR03_06015 [Pontibacter qinzhouensis]
MRFINRLAPAVMLLFFACGPKADTVTTDNISSPDSTSEAVINSPKDGTATSPEDENWKQVLPQEVKALLNRRYPGWEQPVLVKEVGRQMPPKAQGPLLVKADFDGNNKEDLALQVRYKEEVLMLAFLQQEASWQLHQLKKDILFNERGKLKSPFYLYLAKAGLRVRNANHPQPTATKVAAIGIGLDDNVTVFVYEAGSFQAFEVVD